ncbi:hypothetical protein NO932_11575 [Pelagibacterium sp. 26DY04]|uniref:hypothetical protein n=1 Tax=Pelagibacterium sp. 26DY04 TaxID=2967130 RepID=UPI0028162E7E|nr:hypothetical protein [Pelagibacterium sp. 26DY04]WMT85567.1 hypothetical protein NO932_11575 [Pelagibacterium sp. 26DY04]
MPKKLTDREVYERLHAAGLALGNDDGETVIGDTALKAARKDLAMLQMALVAAEEREERLKPSEPTVPS